MFVKLLYDCPINRGLNQIISLIVKPDCFKMFRARVAFHNIKYFEINNSSWEIDQKIPFEVIKKEKDLKINLRSNVEFESINQKLKKFEKLGDYFYLRQGTKPYGSKENKNIELLSKTKKGSNWEKAINGRNISRYYIDYENDYVCRCEDLHSVIDKDVVDGEKIYFQRMRKISLFPRIVASFDDGNYHGLYTCSVITKKNNLIDLKFLLGVINSKLINLWYKYFDTDIEIKLTSVKQIPIKKIPIEEQKEIIEKVDLLLILNVELNKIQSNLILLLQNRFELEKISSKLKNWLNISLKDFLSELKKEVIKFNLSDESDWISFFNDQKEKAHNIKLEIEKTDTEIDKLIYKLFGLNENEIKIVEESVN